MPKQGIGRSGRSGRPVDPWMVARLLLVALSMSIVMATVGLLLLRKGRDPLAARG